MRRKLAAAVLALALAAQAAPAAAEDVRVRVAGRSFVVAERHQRPPLALAKAIWKEIRLGGREDGRRRIGLPAALSYAKRFGLYPTAMRRADVAFIQDRHANGHLSACRLVVELAARRAALDAAVASGVTLHHQGELAQAAQPLRDPLAGSLGCR
jgi:hypothetical protein